MHIFVSFLPALVSTFLGKKFGVVSVVHQQLCRRQFKAASCHLLMMNGFNKRCCFPQTLACCSTTQWSLTLPAGGANAECAAGELDAASRLIECLCVSVQDSTAYFHLLEQIAPDGSKEDVPRVNIEMAGLYVSEQLCFVVRP